MASSVTVRSLRCVAVESGLYSTACKLQTKYPLSHAYSHSAGLVLFTLNINIILVLRIHAIYDKSRKGMQLEPLGHAYRAEPDAVVLIFLMILTASERCTLLS